MSNIPISKYSGLKTANFHYSTVSGDTLSRLTLKYYGDAFLWPDLYEINQGVIGPNPDKLNVGVELKMPKHLNTKLSTVDDLYEKISDAPNIVAAMLKKEGKFDTNKVLVAGGAVLIALALLV